MMGKSIHIGQGDESLALDLSVANRHGLVAGATGTGKTVSLRLLAEGFAQAGVPVFVADVKGDLAGLAEPGQASPRITERLAALGMKKHAFAAMPVVFWDLFGRNGHPLRATISDMGPLLLSRLLGLNDVQRGVLDIVFKVADDEGLLLLDLPDLRAMLTNVSERAKELMKSYGSVSAVSVGAIQRALLGLEGQGADGFFGEPAVEIADLMRTTPDGRGVINVLAAEELIRSPQLYGGFLLWLLAELFEELPEVGDVDKPKLVFFFDEAHLLFNDAPPVLLQQVEQVVRLIRSKGVGIYFCTQSPTDVPDAVLGQLGHRIQHALRAFTPRDKKAVAAAAETFRPRPGLDTGRAIQELAVGEALVSLLDANGVPGMVQRVLIAPPVSRLGPLSAAERAKVMAASPLAGKYDEAVDRESAHEMLAARIGAVEDEDEEEAVAPIKRRKAPPKTTGQQVAEAAMKSAARGVANAIGSSLGRSLVRGVLGALFKK
ncbi:MAG: DUF853 family protein [Alphaproteobacteria bacterium]|nr:DUF853 family protein [Alphaproteobacteria bacterium]